jgi:hypothetical protein
MWTPPRDHFGGQHFCIDAAASSEKTARKRARPEADGPYVSVGVDLGFATQQLSRALLTEAELVFAARLPVMAAVQRAVVNGVKSERVPSKLGVVPVKPAFPRESVDSTGWLLECALSNKPVEGKETRHGHLYLSVTLTTKPRAGDTARTTEFSVTSPTIATSAEARDWQNWLLLSSATCANDLLKHTTVTV